MAFTVKAAAISFILILNALCAFADDGHEYGMVIDAGSTHSTIFVYQYALRVTSSNIAPASKPKQIAESEETGPVGALTSQSASDALVMYLTNFTKTKLADDEDRWGEFPIYLKATAGMRILSNDRREEILGYLENSFSNATINPFRFDTTYAIIASGEEEATFDWLGVNFIYDTLVNNDSDYSTYGALDLGGQSTQIAFAAEPGSNILAGFTAVRLWQKTHRLYAHSHLQYGASAIEQRIAQTAYDEWVEAGSNGSVPNPCLNEGYNKSYDVSNAAGSTESVTQIGDAKTDMHGCKRMLKTLLANDTDCYVPDCAFNGVYLPDIPENMTFAAFSGFAYTVGDIGLSSDADLVNISEASEHICGLTWSEMKRSKYNASRFMADFCRQTHYIYVLLHFGYGFPDTDTPIIFTTKHNGSSLTWTQGSILRDANWLPYDLEYNADSSSSEVRTWRAVGISAIVIAALGCGGLVFAAMKLKGKGTDNYNAMYQ